MGPYTKKEEQDLVLSIRQELAQDLKNPVESSIKTEEVGILNSSLLLFSKIKHLLKRASSISKSQILYNVSQSIERAILDYLESLQSHLGENYKVMGSQATNKSSLYNILNLKNLTNKSQNSSVAQVQREIAEISIILNTCDYIKETVSSVTDLLVSLLESSYHSRVNFNQVDSTAMKVITNCVSGLKNYFVATYPGFSEFSSKKAEFSERMRLLAEDLKSVVGSVYLGKVLSGVCKEIITDWQEGLLTAGKKYKEGDYERIITEFTEIKDILLVLGRDDGGENVSKLYVNLVTKSCEKTLILVKMLGMNNAQLQENLASFKSQISGAELEKVLLIKGMKKADIQKTLSLV